MIVFFVSGWLLVVFAMSAQMLSTLPMLAGMIRLELLDEGGAACLELLDWKREIVGKAVTSQREDEARM